MGLGGELATMYVRLRPSTAGFQTEATSQVKRAMAGTTEASNLAAKEMIANTQAEIKENQLLIASYKEIGSAGAASADEVAIASQRSAALVVRNNELMGASAATAGEATAGLKRHLLSLGSALGLAFGADIAIKGIKDLVNEAGNVQKSVEVIKSSFGPSGEAVTKFGEQGAQALNITTAAADKTAARFGILFKNVGIGQEQAAKMTVGFEKLVGSMSEIRGIDPTPLLQAMTLAAAGNTRGLKQLGIVVDGTTLKYEALKLGLISSVSDAITPAIKAQAIYAIATKNLPEYLDQAAKHSGDLANVQRHLSVEWATAKETLGQDLIPVFSKYTGELSAWLTRMNNSGKLQRDFNTAIKDAGTAVGILRSVFGPVVQALKAFSDAVGGSKHALEIFAAIFLGGKLLGKVGELGKSLALLKVASGPAGAAGGISKLGAALGTAGLVAEVGLASFAITTLILHMTGLDKTAKHVGGALYDFFEGKPGTVKVDQGSGKSGTGIGNRGMQARLAALYPEASKLPSFARDAFIKSKLGPQTTFNFHDAEVFHNALTQTGQLGGANGDDLAKAAAGRGQSAAVKPPANILKLKAGPPLTDAKLQTMLFGGTFNAATVEKQLNNLLNYGVISAAQYDKEQAQVIDKVKAHYAALQTANQAGIQAAKDSLAQLHQSLKDAITQEATDMTDSITQAKDNLTSLGSQLAGSIGDILDRPIQNAQTKIQTMQDKQSLEAYRRSIILPGGKSLSTDPKKALAELEALQKRAGAGAQGEITAVLTKYQGLALAVQQDTVNKRKQDITTGLQDLTDAYGRHQITAKQFHQRVGAILKADLPGYKKIGDLLGTAMANGIQDNVKGLFAQAKALVGFTGRPGTNSSEAKIVTPLKTLHTDQEKIAHIQTQIKDKHGALLQRIAKAAEKQATAAAAEAATLAQIQASQKTSQAKNPGRQGSAARTLTGTRGLN